MNETQNYKSRNYVEKMNEKKNYRKKVFHKKNKQFGAVVLFLDTYRFNINIESL